MNLFDAHSIVANLGAFAVFGVALVIFVETATIFGSFLPGDSLLFILGLTLATVLNAFPFVPAVLIVLVAAIAGSQVGFWTGKAIGPKLFKQRTSWFFNEGTVNRTRDFFERYGGRAIVMSRFVPILRALVPMFVAISGFDRKRFFRLNVIGGTAWVIGLMTSGYLLGGIELVAKNIELSVIIFVIISSLPLPIELAKEAAKRRKRPSEA